MQLPGIHRNTTVKQYLLYGPVSRALCVRHATKQSNSYKERIIFIQKIANPAFAPQSHRQARWLEWVARRVTTTSASSRRVTKLTGHDGPRRATNDRRAATDGRAGRHDEAKDERASDVDEFYLSRGRQYKYSRTDSAECMYAWYSVHSYYYLFVYCV